MRIVNLGLLVLVLACSKQDKAPKEIIGKSEMASILADIHLAEAKVATMGLKSLDSSVMVFAKLQKEIWQKYNVDTARYNQSYRYYVARPEVFAGIYEKVSARLDSTVVADSSHIETDKNLPTDKIETTRE